MNIAHTLRFWSTLPARWLHRRGHGIHSPWAYALITEVLCTRSQYYKFDELDGTESDRQLFRLFVYLKPKRFIACGGTATALNHMKAAYESYQHPSGSTTNGSSGGSTANGISENNASNYELYYFSADRAWEVTKAFKGGWIDHFSCIVLDGIGRKNREIWEAIVTSHSATSTFELYTGRGIAFYDPSHQKQNYLL